MKIITILTIGLLITGITSSCKKEVGPQGVQGVQGVQGPDAKTFNFNLTFNSGDTYQSYNGITGYDSGDVVLTFALYETLGSTGYWLQIPAVISGVANFIPEFSETTGNLFINTKKTDGTTGSPWTSTSTLKFKAVLIKSTGIIKNPDLDLTDYTAVKKAFNLSE